jgi:hypothetical protein
MEKLLSSKLVSISDEYKLYSFNTSCMTFLRYFCNLENRHYAEKIIPKLISKDGTEKANISDILCEQLLNPSFPGDFICFMFFKALRHSCSASYPSHNCFWFSDILVIKGFSSFKKIFLCTSFITGFVELYKCL